MSESRRENPRLSFDREIGGGLPVAGADEAGRGSLAGPLVAAAVCFDYARMSAQVRARLAGLDDSKRLTRERRDEMLVEILREARQVCVVCAAPQTIDREGLHRTNLAALARALTAIDPAAPCNLVDGFALPGCDVAHQAIVGGDGRSAAIAAASIVAKSTRDRVMLRMHEKHPLYGFDHHVGYATVQHHAALLTAGTCTLHRLSFASVAYAQLELQL